MWIVGINRTSQDTFLQSAKARIIECQIQFAFSVMLLEKTPLKCTTIWDDWFYWISFPISLPFLIFHFLFCFHFVLLFYISLSLLSNGERTYFLNIIDKRKNLRRKPEVFLVADLNGKSKKKRMRM